MSSGAVCCDDDASVAVAVSSCCKAETGVCSSNPPRPKWIRWKEFIRFSHNVNRIGSENFAQTIQFIYRVFYKDIDPGLSDK